MDEKISGFSINWRAVIIAIAVLLTLGGGLLIRRRATTSTLPPTDLAYSVSPIPTSPTPTLAFICPDTAALRDELVQIRAEIRSLKQVLGSSGTNLDSLSELLADEASTATSSVTLANSSVKTLDVHQEPTTSSRVVGQIVWGQNYPYLGQQGNWYKIQVIPNLFGFVPSQNVKIL